MSTASVGSFTSSMTTSSDRSSTAAAAVINRRSQSSDVSQPQLLQLGEDKDFLEFPKFSEEEIKSALKAEAEKHATWKTGAVKQMKIVNVDTSVAFRYTLESFTETRSTYEVCEQFKGRDLDTAIQAGPLPSVWDVVSHPAQMFTEEMQLFEMPGSVSYQDCTVCHGQTSGDCYKCRSVGTIKCSVCNGTGMRTGVPHPLVGPGVNRGMKGKSNGRNQPIGLGAPFHFDGQQEYDGHRVVTAMDLCHVCKGQGVKECAPCNGEGKQGCATCGGNGQMKKYTQLKIRYELDKSDYLHEAGLPDDVLRRVHGEVIMTETRPHVYPMKNFPVAALNEQSRRLVQSHLNKHKGTARILQQRHLLEAIPVATVNYDFNGHKGSCWVIGSERLAYIPQFPQKCSIL